MKEFARNIGKEVKLEYRYNTSFVKTGIITAITCKRLQSKTKIHFFDNEEHQMERLDAVDWLLAKSPVHKII
jgi:hypothetical protein